jgi:hypothetical protein
MMTWACVILDANFNTQYLGALPTPNTKAQDIKFFKISELGYDKAKRKSLQSACYHQFQKNVLTASVKGSGQTRSSSRKTTRIPSPSRVTSSQARTFSEPSSWLFMATACRRNQLSIPARNSTPIASLSTSLVPETLPQQASHSQAATSETTQASSSVSEPRRLPGITM